MKNNFTRLQNISLSNIAILAVVLSCLSIDFIFKNWEERDRVIEEDVHWYYGYLPAFFIYDDIKLKKSDYHFGDNYYLFWTSEAPNGEKVIRTTMGTAVLYAPFFFIAHGYSIVSEKFSDSGYAANGFSEPYKLFLLLSAVFYLYIGLEFLKKILSHYAFSEQVIASTILLIGMGTNLLCYASQSAPLPHVYNFCLFAIFIYYTIKWHESPSLKNTLITGFSMGLISLIRPSNAVLLIFFIFYGISGLSEIKLRVLLLKNKWPLMAVFFFTIVICWLPQLYYWKKITGDYLFYSYGEEHFFWKNPKIMEGLFSFRKGWLVYTPMMGFALPGIVFMKGELKKLRLSVILFFAVNIYIIFSWWCWWYGGSFGQRSLIESYALLALPLASFIQYVIHSKYLKYLFFLFALFFVFLNGFQTAQYELNSLHWDGMTKELYLKQFGKLARIPDFEQYVKRPNYEEAKRGNSCEFNRIDSDFIKKNIQNIRTVNLKAYNGKFICADSGLKNAIIADKEKASTWETFKLIPVEKNIYALQAHTDLFLSTEIDRETEITATMAGIGEWERYLLIDLGNGFVSFKATNGKYLSVDENSLRVYANSDSIGEKEKFEIIL